MPAQQPLSSLRVRFRRKFWPQTTLRLPRHHARIQKDRRLEPDDFMARSCVGDENAVDLFLRYAMSPRPLSDKDFDGRRRRLIQERWIDQLVVHDYLRGAQQFQSANGEQPGIARACANEIDLSACHRDTPKSFNK